VLHRPDHLPRADLLIALCVAALAGVEVMLNARIAPRPVAFPVEIAMGAALAWRRRSPLAVSIAEAVLGIALIGGGVPLTEPIVDMLATVVAAYSLVSYATTVRAVIGSVLIAASVGVQTALAHEGFSNLAFAAVFLAAMWLMGLTVRRRTAHAVRTELAAERLSRDAEDRVTRAAAEERARIARELHDVVAHSLSVMVVQAGAAEQLLRHDPRRALGPVRSVQRVGQEAITEMSHLLGVLRDGGPEPGLAPQPGLEELVELVRQSRDAGLDVRLEIDEHLDTVPPGLALTVYRIVQEALTNSRKHAGAEYASVRVSRLDDHLLLEVVDSGGHGSPTGTGGGHGLLGMRERVAVYGGTLSAGPVSPRGFRVRANIPIGAAP